VPTIAQRRHFIVTVSDATDYRGWVLAADADHAQTIALEMIAEGVLDTDGGNLAVVHLDREVSAVPATDVCWQCGEDPRLPHPRCSHPAPGTATASHTIPSPHPHRRPDRRHRRNR